MPIGLGIVAAGDGVVPHALLMVGEAIHCHPDWQVIYGDEAAIDPNGRVSDPLFKPDFSLEYLRALPYPGSFRAVPQRRLLTQLNGFDSPVMPAMKSTMQCCERMNCLALPQLVMYRKSCSCVRC
jgi:hypothetical protein